MDPVKELPDTKVGLLIYIDELVKSLDRGQYPKDKINRARYLLEKAREKLRGLKK